MAIDASLIEADANKQNSTPGEEWDVESIDPKDAPRAVREYFDTLGEAAFGAASEVQPKFTSHSDPESQWTAARKGPASFSYSDNYLIDTGQGHTINKTGRGRFEQDDAEANEGTWTRADFEWDAENDQYICPEGHALKQFRRNYSDPNRGPTSEGTARYRAIKEVCQVSPSKAKCCPNADARKITREETQEEGGKALRPPQTYSWPWAAQITRSMWSQRRIPTRPHRPEPAQTGKDLSCTAAGGKSLIRKMPASRSERHLLRDR